MQKRDVFEELAQCVGCHYISDLRTPAYNRAAKEAFRQHFLPENYALKDLSALYRYLYKTEITFESHTEVRKAFGLKKEINDNSRGGKITHDRDFVQDQEKGEREEK